jgi:uncharacterized NAD-dependent epimerase/dehydratase family protein
MPTDMILCIRAGQTELVRSMDKPIPMPPFPALIKLYEDVATMCGSFPAAKVRAMAVNTSHLNSSEASEFMKELASITGLPVCDPVRDSAQVLVDALLA